MVHCLLKAMLRTVLMDDNEVMKYSWHSFRIGLACGCLKVMGNTPETRATIQAVCRWATQDALKVYARLEATVSDVVKEASRVDFTSSQVANLPQLIKDASRSDIDGIHTEDLPDLDNDSKWAGADTHTAAAFDKVQRSGDDVADDAYTSD